MRIVCVCVRTLPRALLCRSTKGFILGGKVRFKGKYSTDPKMPLSSILPFGRSGGSTKLRHLYVRAPPSKHLHQCLTCYVLLQVEWLSQSPTDEEPAIFADRGSLSSHRKHGDGTYSVSSHLVVPADVVPGTQITCRVSHVALDAPVSVSVLVEHLEEGTDSGRKRSTP